MAKPDLAIVYAELRRVMERHADALVTASESATAVSFEKAASGPADASRWYGAVQTKKNYVSYHLMPVYEHPDLLDGISPELRARLHGKSCFNFRAVDTVLFDELDALTARGFRRFDADVDADDME